MSAPRPLVVVGPARAGTTLVARMLDAHPQVTVASDPLLPVLRSVRDAAVASAAPGSLPAGAPFQDCYFAPGPRDALDALLAAPSALPVAPGSIEALRAAVVARARHEEPALAPRLAELDGATHGDLVRGAFAAIGALDPAARVIGTKEVWALDAVPFLARALPGLRAVVVRRDPRAVVASTLGVARDDPAQVGHPFSVARHWRKQEALLAEVAHAVGPRSLLVVGYEDVLADRRAASRELTAFLGVEPRDDLGDADRLRDRSGRPWRANSSFGSPGPGVRPELARSWPDRLDEDDLAAIELVVGPELPAAGYTPVVDPGRVFGAPSLDALRAADRGSWSWRSDSGRPEEQHARELRRWALADGSPPAPGEVRSHFLFGSALARVRLGAAA